MHSEPSRSDRGSKPHRPITTWRGRVVYDRKPHYFTFTDLLRITLKIGQREVLEMLDAVFALLVRVINQIYRLFYLDAKKAAERYLQVLANQVIVHLLSASSHTLEWFIEYVLGYPLPKITGKDKTSL